MTRRTTIEYLLAGIAGIGAGLLGSFLRRPVTRLDTSGDRVVTRRRGENVLETVPSAWWRLHHIPLPDDVCLDGMEHCCAVAYICGMYGLRPRLDYWSAYSITYFLPFGPNACPWTRPGMTGAEALARICGATAGRIRSEGVDVLVYERADPPHEHTPLSKFARIA